MTRPERPHDPNGTHARRHTFPRSRRLKRRRLIRALFDRGREDVRVVRAGALVVRYRTVSPTDVGSASPVQVGFATGRHVRTKPARNRIKRVMRETFRVHQHALVDLFASRPDSLTLMVLYRGAAAKAARAIPQHLPDLLLQIAHDLSTSEARSA